MGANIDHSLRHPPADAERQFGAYARLDVASQADGGLARLEMDDFPFEPMSPVELLRDLSRSHPGVPPATTA
jgi:hypothetical protein